MTRTLLVMAAGTGGHVFPGLAIARELARRGWRIVWMGTPAGMERNNPALWVSESGERLTGSGIRGILRRRSARAGVTEPSPHDFRRAFALERWRAGTDIVTLSKLMGHKGLQVLNRYISNRLVMTWPWLPEKLRRWIAIFEAMYPV